MYCKRSHAGTLSKVFATVLFACACNMTPTLLVGEDCRGATWKQMQDIVGADGADGSPMMGHTALYLYVYLISSLL